MKSNLNIIGIGVLLFFIAFYFLYTSPGMTMLGRLTCWALPVGYLLMLGFIVVYEKQQAKHPTIKGSPPAPVSQSNLSSQAAQIETLIKTIGTKKNTVSNERDVLDSAIRQITRIDKQTLIEPLVRALEDQTYPQRDNFATVLGKLGDPKAVEPLIAALNSDKESVRYRAAEALGEIGEAEAVDPLLAALSDSGSKMTHYYAAEALGKIGEARAVEHLLTALASDSDDMVRIHAAEALGKIGDVRAVKPLIAALLHDEKSGVRCRAAQALGEIGDVRAAQAVIESAANDPDQDVRRWAEEALPKLGEEAVTAFKLIMEGQAVKLDQNGHDLFERMHADNAKAGPIAIKGTQATVYWQNEMSSGRKWLLSIPTGSKVMENRKIAIDPEQDPDRFVFEALQDAPQWTIDPVPAGKLFKLITSGKHFDYHNPIIIKNLAYLYLADYPKGSEWELRVPTSREAERSIPLAKISPINENLDQAVLDMIAAVGMSLIGKA